jgi:hypothetical protein
MLKRSSSAFSAGLLTAGLLSASALAIHRVGRRSGVSDEEVRRPLPGDSLVTRPLWASTRAITIDAPPSVVWPWIVQMGYPTFRAGWYTPHWLDQVMWGKRPRSADRIVADLQRLKVGDRIPDSSDWSVFYVVEELVPERHLLLHSVSHVFPPVTESDFTWVFALEPHGTGRTRLCVRARVSYRPRWAYPALEIGLGLGDYVNMSVMLNGIKARAERQYLG